MRSTLVVDSGCDIPDSVRKSLGIELWPIEIIYPDRTEPDLRDESQLSRLVIQPELLSDASTRPMPLGQARAKLMEFATRHDKLLYLSIMGSRSPALEQAQQAVTTLPLSLKTERKMRNLPAFDFLVQNSELIFAGYAWSALLAAKRLRAGLSIEQVQAELAQIVASISLYMIPGELHTIRARSAKKGEKSVSWLTYAVGTALDIKPVIAGCQGKTGVVGKVRGFDAAILNVIQTIIGQIENKQLKYPLITMSYGGSLRDLNKIPAIAKLIEVTAANGIELVSSMMGATGLINVGPGAFSIALASNTPPYGDFSELK